MTGNRDISAKRRRLGVLSTVSGAFLWGLSGTCAQYLFADYAISTLFLSVMRTFGASLIFMTVLLVRNRDVVKSFLQSKFDVLVAALFGVFGVFCSQITYMATIGFTNSGTATVLQCTSIVMIMLVVCAKAHRLPRGRELAGLVLAFVATVLIATKGDLTQVNLPIAGLAWGILSAFTAVAYSLLPKTLYEKWGSFVAVGFGMLFGFVAASLAWGISFAIPEIDAVVSAGNSLGTDLLPTFDAKGYVALAIIVVFGTFGAFYLFVNGVAIIGPVQGSQLGAVEPVSATVLSALLMSTVFGWADWLGLALMVATIIIVASTEGASDIQSSDE